MVLFVLCLFIMLIPFGFMIFNPFNPIVTGILILIAVAILISIIIMAHHSLEAVISAIRKIAQVQEKGLLGTVNRTFGPIPILLCLPLVLFVVLSPVLGIAVARDSKTFLVTNTDPEYAIVGTYSTALLGIPVSAKNATFDSSVKLIGIDQVETGIISLTTADIGPLQNLERPISGFIMFFF